MPTLAVTDFNIVCATLGGFISLFGLVSYLFKETFYLSEALISLLAGILFSPPLLNLLRPLTYTNGSPEVLETTTLAFSRLVLGIQLVLAGVQLPSRYLFKEWKSLSLLLGPGMLAMWLCSSAIIYALVPASTNMPFLHALAIAACITPTDPVLSNSIVKGKFADQHVPRALQRVIIAESGANDGLGYPFLFGAVYFIRFIGAGAGGEGLEGDGIGRAVALWFGETLGYTILLSVLYGAVVGWVAKELLHWAEERKYIDRESFLVFAIALALFIVGTCGMMGSDDVLACFIAGNVFTIDDWFRLETIDDSLQPTIDMLLNLSIFMWFGAVCPWHKFVDNGIIPLPRLIGLGLLILLFRRIPIIFAMHRYIWQIEEVRQAAFVGFFGPIGVSAIFYLYICREYLEDWLVPWKVREDAVALAEQVEVVVWFLVICSIVVHGLTIPLAKLGIHLPRTLSSALSFNSEIDGSNSSYPFRFSRGLLPSLTSVFTRGRRRDRSEPPGPIVFRIGRPVIPERDVEREEEGNKGSSALNAKVTAEGKTLVEESSLERRREQGIMRAQTELIPVLNPVPEHVRFPGGSDRSGSSKGESSSNSSSMGSEAENGHHLRGYGATVESPLLRTGNHV
ncbi:hypothetical protein AJ79_03471 [Helicocarpus griseus UAMH5409]|uniref:Cation/H+ exchanger transmembrane domain-containing protein n=1 Tax=Helicocarpus griseus UAMH5409 TaxID=1447875 RepID=A0A2B7XYS0_9EURO|nr:hypothetical protein AJ79_03471 [Helicocarpus griseus UAMH5409]